MRVVRKKVGKHVSRKKSAPYDKLKLVAEKRVNDRKSLREILVGDVTHYFPKIMVCVVNVVGPPLRVGDSVRFKGRLTDFQQIVKSMQVESQDVNLAKKGQLVGIKVETIISPGDKIYKLPPL